MDNVIKLIELRCITWNLHYALEQVLAQAKGHINPHEYAKAVEALAASQAAYDADPWDK